MGERARGRAGEKTKPERDKSLPFVHSPVLRFILYPLTSGILLTLSFPNFNFGFLAWIALVPLLYAIYHSKSRAQAAFSGWITGLVFYAFSLHWLVNVSTFGWLFVTFLETSFLVLFALSAYEIKTNEKAFSISWLVSKGSSSKEQ
jgi:apolipoprotein N-acyltransferase